MPLDRRRPATWLESFLALEASGGLVLAAAAAIAVLLANGPLSETYQRFWASSVGPLDLHHWVGDGLLSLFFLVVGLELKRELTTGELRDRRAAALPVLGALGGMVVPALLYAAIAGGRGWGVVVATDIAFALGVVSLLGSRVPPPVRVFLLVLAVADDLGAILVLAVLFTSGVSFGWLAVAGVLLVVSIPLRRQSEWWLLPVGVALWWATHESGVHATLAGVALGVTTPSARCAALEARLHPWSAYVVLPLFGLAAAGVGVGALTDPAERRVVVAVVVGLVVGKPLGIGLAVVLALQLRIGRLPPGTSLRSVLAAGVVAGMGFTVALFLADLSFVDPGAAGAAKAAVLVASMLGAVGGSAALVVAARRR